MLKHLEVNGLDHETTVEIARRLVANDEETRNAAIFQIKDLSKRDGMQTPDPLQGNYDMNDSSGSTGTLGLSKQSDGANFSDKP